MTYTHRGDNSLPYSRLYIIAIDLGEITGIALYDAYCQSLVCSSLIYPVEVVPIIDFIKPEIIILERFPRNRSLSPSIEAVYNNVITRRETGIVSPGNWKSVMKSRKLKFSQASNQHEKDAIDMIRYYLFCVRGEEIKCQI